MKIKIKINKKPFTHKLELVKLLRDCDKSLSLSEAKNMVETALAEDKDDILEFNLPIGSIAGVDIDGYAAGGNFIIYITETEDVESPEKIQILGTLKPGTLVLVRDYDTQEWELNIFAHYTTGINEKGYPYTVISETPYAQCVVLEGNEHLLSTKDPAGTMPPLPKPTEPTYDDNIKRYRVIFGNTVLNYTDQQLYNFIKTAVLHNRDIGTFAVIDTEKCPLS